MLKERIANLHKYHLSFGRKEVQLDELKPFLGDRYSELAIGLQFARAFNAAIKHQLSPYTSFPVRKEDELRILGLLKENSKLGLPRIETVSTTEQLLKILCQVKEALVREGVWIGLGSGAKIFLVDSKARIGKTSINLCVGAEEDSAGIHEPQDNRQKRIQVSTSVISESISDFIYKMYLDIAGFYPIDRNPQTTLKTIFDAPRAAVIPRIEDKRVEMPSLYFFLERVVKTQLGLLSVENLSTEDPAEMHLELLKRAIQATAVHEAAHEFIFQSGRRYILQKEMSARDSEEILAYLIQFLYESSSAGFSASVFSGGSSANERAMATITAELFRRLSITGSIWNEKDDRETLGNLMPFDQTKIRNVLEQILEEKWRNHFQEDFRAVLPVEEFRAIANHDYLSLIPTALLEKLIVAEHEFVEWR